MTTKPSFLKFYVEQLNTDPLVTEALQTVLFDSQ